MSNDNAKYLRPASFLYKYYRLLTEISYWLYLGFYEENPKTYGELYIKVITETFFVMIGIVVQLSLIGVMVVLPFLKLIFIICIPFCLFVLIGMSHNSGLFKLIKQKISNKFGAGKKIIWPDSRTTWDEL